MFDYEAGYRAQPSKRLSFDVTGFFSDYRRLQTAEPGLPYFTLVPAPPHLVLPLVYGNFGRAKNYGVEISAQWRVTSKWLLRPGFSFLEMNVSLDPRSGDTAFPSTPDDSSKHHAGLRSTVNLPHNLEWDASAYYVGSLEGGLVPAYTRVDTRFGWRIRESVDLSITGQNLLTPRHVEFLDALQVNPTRVERSVSAKVTWRF